MIEDYSIRFYEERNELIGVDARGKKVYQYKTLYKTGKYGAMEPEKWRREIHKEIHLEGEEELLEEIEEYCREWLGWLKKEQEIEDYAMNCLAKRAYLHWKDFQKEIIWM